MNDDCVIKVYERCLSVFAKHNINVSFPSNTDKRKTYKWRYLQKFCDKLIELNIEDSDVDDLINGIVEYASTHNLIKQGLSILNSTKAIESSIKSLNLKSTSASNVVDHIKTSKQFITGLGNTARSHLSYKSSRIAVPNLVLYVMSGKISQYYVAVSKLCNEIYNNMNEVDRSKFDNLDAVRYKIISHRGLKSIKEIIGDDWFYDRNNNR